MKKTDEKKVQSDSWIWFQRTYGQPSHSPQLLMHSVINGIGISFPKEDKIPSAIQQYVYKLLAKWVSLQKLLGLVPGVSDTLIHGVMGRVIWCEFKEATGDQRKEQIRQQERTEKNGGIYIMPRSLYEFQQKISENIDWLLGK